MPTRIRVLQRVVADIAVPVEGLGIARCGDNHIGLEKPPEGGIVVARLVEVEAGGIQAFTRELLRELCIVAPNFRALMALLEGTRLDFQANHSDVCVAVSINRMRCRISCDNFRKKVITQFDRQAVRIGKPGCSQPTQ